MDSTTIILFFVVSLSIITAIKYLIYSFSSPFYFINKTKFLEASKNTSRQEIENTIKISVVIPAWNEEVGVIQSVKSILNTTYNNIEVILVDDGSTDNTFSKVKQFENDYLDKIDIHPGKTFKYFKKENGGKGSALNFGIKNSTGNIIVTMDADTIFDKYALENVAKYFINKNIDAAVGNVKIANSKSLLGIIQQIEYIIGFYFKRTHSLFNSEYIIGGAFGIFRRNVFEKYGYFDENNKTEDIEFSTRLQSHGCTIAYIEDAIAYTEGPSTIDGLMKQRLRWKKGRLDTFYKHRNLFFSRDKKHSKFLTHFLLPMTLFYEIELLIEPFLTIFGAYYIYTTFDFKALIIWIAFTGVIHTTAFIFGSKKNNKITIALIPFYFVLSYVITYIEIYAMYKSLKLIFLKKEVQWQTWTRKGIQNI